MPEITERLPDLLEVVRTADIAVMGVYDSGNVAVEVKSDLSPLTQADIASHHILIKGIQELFPDVPIISEEGDAEENRVRLRSEHFWLVDPLDGTGEFIKRSGHFAICGALVKNNEPIFGFISAPALGVTYYGGKGMGSFRERVNSQKETERKSLNITLHDPPVIMASLSDLDAATAAFIAEHYPDSPIERVGSQLKFPQIAEGTGDIYPRLNSPLHLWDVAAGHAILLGVGGTVTQIDGGILDYQNPSFKIGDFIARNN